jgi:TrmH family RNA methyltransferase
MLVKSQIKYIQSLGQKKSRDELQVFIAEGPKIVSELIAAVPDQVTIVFATEQWITENPSTRSQEVIPVDENELARISQLTTPNQVLAVIKKFIVPPAITVRDTVVLALDTIQDPGNMGTIIRIADWFGIEQLVCSHACADMYNPKVVQSSMGSIARVKIFYTDLHAWLSAEADVRVYAASLEGHDVRKMEKLHEGIIIIGNESKGISPQVMDRVNVRINIPRKGRAESLNAAVAAGIILSHLS